MVRAWLEELGYRVAELRGAGPVLLRLSGVKLERVSQWYGHGDLKTTMRYLRIVEHDMPEPEDLPL